MEDVLAVYKRPHDAKRPVVCFDEMNRQLVAETRTPVPGKPGQPTRYDYEYRRNGTVNLLMMFEPLKARRHVKVTRQRTRKDFAACIRELLDVHYADVETVVLVLDNLNTHTPGSLYEAFEPEEAKRLTEKLEIHYTPKHGSWLNIAEIELGILSRQCLKDRMETQGRMADEVAAWEKERNEKESTVDWQFTTADARIKLKSLYPSIQ